MDFSGSLACEVPTPDAQIHLGRCSREIMKIEVIEKKLMHYISKAINDFNMIQKGDRVMVCLSGGKDSYTLLTILNKIRVKMKCSFELHSYTLDQAQPGWDDAEMREFLESSKIPYTIERRDTYSVVMEK